MEASSGSSSGSCSHAAVHHRSAATPRTPSRLLLRSTTDIRRMTTDPRRLDVLSSLMSCPLLSCLMLTSMCKSVLPFVLTNAVCRHWRCCWVSLFPFPYNPLVVHLIEVCNVTLR